MPNQNAVQQSVANPFDPMIHKVRGQDIMLDSDLAVVYQVSPSALNQAVNRNIERFPEEFSFQLSKNEWNILRSQIVTLKTGHGEHRKYLPRAFTEHGAVMLATVLNSPRAIEASKDIVRAFVRLRHVVKSSTPPTIEAMLADPRAMLALLTAYTDEREKRELLEDREAVFGNRTPYGEISKTTGLPRTIPTRGYLHSPRTKITTIITTITEQQLRLFDWE